MRPPTICHLLQMRFAESPQRIAYTFDSSSGSTDANGSSNGSAITQRESLTLTDRDVVLQAIQLAERIQQQAQPGDRALLIFPPGLEFIISFYACMLARVIAVPANYPRASRVTDRLRAIINDCEPSIAITTKAAQELMGRGVDELPESIRWMTFDQGEGGSALEPGEALSQWTEGTTPKDVAFLQYTSGSTSDPKGVIVSHGNLIHNLSVIETGFRPEDFSSDQGERSCVFWLPAYHDMGLIGTILMPFYAGWHSVLMPPASFLRRPVHWLRLISEHRAMLSGAPNFALDLCVEKVTSQQIESLDLSCLRLLFCGAEPVRAESIRRFESTFGPAGFRSDIWYPCFGLAESTLMASGPVGAQPIRTIEVDREKLVRNEIELIDATRPDKGATATFVGCGAAHCGQRIAIIDQKNQRQKEELELGEIWVSGASVAKGYWGRPEETREAFEATIEGDSKRRWLKTGDLGFTFKGDLFVTGRVKDLIIIRGQNHYPQDIECAVSRAHEALLEPGAAAFGINTNEAEQLVVVQELDRRYRSMELDQVIQSIRSEISSQFELDLHALVLIRQASLPRTTSGKVRRSLCRQQFLEGTLVEHARWESSPSQSPIGGGIDPEERAQLVRKLIDRGDVKQLAEEIESWLVDWIQQRCSESLVELNGDTPFTSTGLDSISALELSFELEQWLQIEISPILAWNQPTAATLASHLAESAIESSQSHTN